MRRRTPGYLIVLLIGSIFMTSMQAAYAGVITTEEYLHAFDRNQALDRIDSVLARAEVKRQLEKFGVDPTETAERVAALSDAELQQLADQLETLPAAGNLLAVIGVVFIVLLILELVGVTNIFNRI